MAGETANLELAKALQTIDEAIAYEGPLRRRAEGLTWVVWGLVTATTWLAYEVSGGDYRLWYATMPVAWGAMGLVATAAVWRLAGLASPELAPSAKRVALYAFAAIVALVLMASAGYYADAVLGTEVVRALSISIIPWALLGLVQWSRLTTQGRRATLAAGAVMAILLTIVAMLEGSLPQAVAVIGGVPFALGLAWTLTG